MKTEIVYTHSIEIWEHFFIPLADGTKLAAKAWLPVNAVENPVPAILEYIPYRKRDGTAIRDEQMHPYWAGFGYACLRVDMRGCGESDGLLLDEYLPQELEDGIEVINWLADQSWCTGKIGMMGKSWGGFNCLQIAALNPEPLKAILSVCSTDDRYADDIHYRGGALLLENFSWAATMMCYMGKAPDPLLLPESWKDRWLERLDALPFLAKKWLEHTHKDEYWKHGSINENYDSIKAAVYCVGGWGDAYSEAIPRMMNGLSCPRKALIGPWAHKYPHFAKPAPEIDFLYEAKRWWDYWLKNEDNGIMDEACITAYIQDSVPPKSSYLERPGKWVRGDSWPIQNKNLTLYPSENGTLSQTADQGKITVSSPQTTGAASGEYCVIWCGPDFPTDQRVDDANSICFDSETLENEVSMLGAAFFNTEVKSDQACGHLIVRLCDVNPDGESTRVSYGILNLTLHLGLDQPLEIIPDRPYKIEIKLDDTGYQFPQGHKIRLSLSTNYFPLIWPAPEKVKLSLNLEKTSLNINLFQNISNPVIEYGKAFVPPVSETSEVRPENHQRKTLMDAANGKVTTLIEDDFGAFTLLDHGLTVGEKCTEEMSILAHDPLSAKFISQWHSEQSRDDWRVDVYSHLQVTCDKDFFYLKCGFRALENKLEIRHQQWNEKVPRDTA